jgi:malonyl-CoA O-methyltransferase
VTQGGTVQGGIARGGPMRADSKAWFALDPVWVRRSHNRASGSYDAAAVLLSRLELTALTPALVIDAGAGTGHASRALKRRYPRARVIAVDAAFGMLRMARRQQSWRHGFDRICADAERLPFADQSVDLILSNLMLHWCDAERVFAECRRVLKPRGSFCFTSFGPDTLRELRGAWEQVDAQSHVNRFLDMHDLGDALVRAGFAAPVLDVDRLTLTYADLRSLMADLKAVGARNFTAARPRGLVGRDKFAKLHSAYEAFREQGRLPATYEVIYAQAWAPADSSRRHDPPNSSVSLDEIKRQLHARRVT